MRCGLEWIQSAFTAAFERYRGVLHGARWMRDNRVPTNGGLGQDRYPRLSLSAGCGIVDLGRSTSLIATSAPASSSKSRLNEVEKHSQSSPPNIQHVEKSSFNEHPTCGKAFIQSSLF
eukprot:scaffold20325_cov33-Tisochrysis_lutea.AAC.2